MSTYSDVSHRTFIDRYSVTDCGLDPLHATDTATCITSPRGRRHKILTLKFVSQLQSNQLLHVETFR